MYRALFCSKLIVLRFWTSIATDDLKRYLPNFEKKYFIENSFNPGISSRKCWWGGG